MLILNYIVFTDCDEMTMFIIIEHDAAEAITWYYKCIKLRESTKM